MKAFLLLNLGLTMLAIIADRGFKLRLYRCARFWWFQLLVAGLTIGTDTFASGAPFVIYNPQFVYSWRLLSVPAENILFGFNLIYLNLLVFEKINVWFR